MTDTDYETTLIMVSVTMKAGKDAFKFVEDALSDAFEQRPYHSNVVQIHLASGPRATLLEDGRGV